MAAGYRQKIDLIYIDPPYNTKEQPSYKDKFKRCAWLSMMKERLELAQQLLSPAGVIFVSIGDEEQAYLKVLMDGIFNEAQFAGMAVRKTRTVLNRLQNNFNNQHDYCLIYQRDPQQPLNGEQKNLNKYRNPDHDPNGKWYAGDPSIGLALAGKQANIFSIKNPFTGQVDNPPVNCHWRFTEQKLQAHVQSGKIKFYHHIRPGRRGFIFKRYQSEINTNFKTFDSLRFADTAYINARATKNLRQILDSDWKFFYPKPVNFIAELLRAVTNPHALVLDFFAGSGTTAQAVLALNRQDGGHRRFILCTNNENQIADLCYERLHRIMLGRSTQGKTYFSWLSTNQPYGGQLLVYDLQCRNLALNPTVDSRGNFALDKSWSQNLQATYQRLNPHFIHPPSSEWLRILLQLTLNACAADKPPVHEHAI